MLTHEIFSFGHQLSFEEVIITTEECLHYDNQLVKPYLLQLLVANSNSYQLL